MLHSMTGYGKSSANFHDKKISVEIKALNSKTMDLYVRLSSNYREKELEIRQLIAQELDRGKVEVTISIENSGSVKSIEINKDLAKAYYTDLKETNQILGNITVDYLPLIVKMPDILIQSSNTVSKEEFLFLDELVLSACNELHRFRRQEGVALEKEFSVQINHIASLLEKVEDYEGLRIETIRERMRKGLEDASVIGLDESRFHQELIFYIEKLDISEEKMRLKNHLDYFIETMTLPATGKKLGFISQEIGREINTLGSKSYHLELQKLVVEMKDSLEKIKEQILNTL